MLYSWSSWGPWPRRQYFRLPWELLWRLITHAKGGNRYTCLWAGLQYLHVTRYNLVVNIEVYWFPHRHVKDPQVILILFYHYLIVLKYCLHVSASPAGFLALLVSGVTLRSLERVTEGWQSPTAVLMHTIKFKIVPFSCVAHKDREGGRKQGQHKDEETGKGQGERRWKTAPPASPGLPASRWIIAALKVTQSPLVTTYGVDVKKKAKTPGQRDHPRLTRTWSRPWPGLDSSYCLKRVSIRFRYTCPELGQPTAGPKTQTSPADRFNVSSADRQFLSYW